MDLVLPDSVGAYIVRYLSGGSDEVPEWVSDPKCRASFDLLWCCYRQEDAFRGLRLWAKGDAANLLPAVRHVILHEGAEARGASRRNPHYTTINVGALEGFCQLELALQMQAATEALGGSRGFPILEGQHMDLAEKLRAVYGRWCGLQVATIWNAPAFAIDYLDHGGDLVTLHRLRLTAVKVGVFRPGAESLAAQAAVTGNSTLAADFAVAANGQHVIEAGCVEVGVQEAHDCMVERQDKIQSILSELVCAIIAHGLDVLRLDVFARSPWLSREVCKVMDLPYLELAVDRANWLLDEKVVSPI